MATCTQSLESIEYKALAACSHKLVIAFKASHLTIANELCSKGIIPKEVLSKAAMVGVSDEAKVTWIVEAALNQVQVCPRKYHDFMMLSSFSEPCFRYLHEEITAVYESLTKAGTIRHVKKAENGSDDIFFCRCGKCSLDQYLDEGCPISNSEQFPYLNVGSLDEDDREDLTQKLLQNITEMIKSFARLTDDVRVSLDKRGISVRRLIARALTLGAYYDSHVMQKPLLSEDNEKLHRAETVQDVFIILQPHMSFFNHELLKHITDSEELCTDDDRKQVDEYCTKFNDFCRRKTFEIPPGAFGQSTATAKKSKRKAFAVLITKQEGQSLEFVNEAKHKIASILKLKSSTLHLHRIDEGCIILVFSVPDFVARAIFPLGPSTGAELESEGFHIAVPLTIKDNTETAHYRGPDVANREESSEESEEEGGEGDEDDLIEKYDDYIYGEEVEPSPVNCPALHRRHSTREPLDNNRDNDDEEYRPIPRRNNRRRYSFCRRSTIGNLCLLTTAIVMVMSVGWRDVRKDPIEKLLWENEEHVNKYLEIGAREIRILVTGKTGTGKSALINGIMGANVTKEGGGGLNPTTTVEQFRRMVRKTPMIVFDSPGLQDGTNKEKEYLLDMERKCKEVDLVLYTLKMSNKRLHADDTEAMRKLTHAFGEKFWENAMFVLTFANDVRDPEDPEDETSNRIFFEHKLNQWGKKLPEIVEQKLNVSKDVAEHIPVVPAGYYMQPHLPGRRYWFSEFWRAALDRMRESNKEGYRLILEFQRDRFKSVYELTPEDLEGRLYEQPIVMTLTDFPSGSWNTATASYSLIVALLVLNNILLL